MKITPGEGSLEFEDENHKTSKVNASNFQVHSVKKIMKDAISTKTITKNLLDLVNDQENSKRWLLKGSFRQKSVKLVLPSQMYSVLTGLIFDVFVRPYSSTKESRGQLESSSQKLKGSDFGQENGESGDYEKDTVPRLENLEPNSKNERSPKSIIEGAFSEHERVGQSVKSRFDEDSGFDHNEGNLKRESTSKSSAKNQQSTIRNTVFSERNFLVEFQNISEEDLLKIQTYQANIQRIEKQINEIANKNSKRLLSIEPAFKKSLFKPVQRNSKSMRLGPSFISIENNEKVQSGQNNIFLGMEEGDCGLTKWKLKMDSDSQKMKSIVSEQIKWAQESKNSLFLKPNLLGNVFFGRNEKFFQNIPSVDSEESAKEAQSKKIQSKTSHEDLNALAVPLTSNRIYMGPVFDWKMPRPRLIDEEDFIEPNIYDSKENQKGTNSTLNLQKTSDLTTMIWDLRIEEILPKIQQARGQIKDFSILEAMCFITFISGNKDLLRNPVFPSDFIPANTPGETNSSLISQIDGLLVKSALTSAQACCKLFWNENDDTEFRFRLMNDAENLENFYLLNEKSLNDYFGSNPSALNMLFFSKFIKIAFQKLGSNSQAKMNEKGFDEMGFIKVSFYILSKRAEKSALVLILFVLVMTKQRSFLTISKLFDSLELLHLPLVSLLVSLSGETLIKMTNLGSSAYGLMVDLKKRLKACEISSKLLSTHLAIFDLNEGRFDKARARVKKVLMNSDLQVFLDDFRNSDFSSGIVLFEGKMSVEKYHGLLKKNPYPRVWEKNLIWLLDVGLEMTNASSAQKEVLKPRVSDVLASLETVPLFMEFSWFSNDDFRALAENYLHFGCFDLIFFELAYHLNFDERFYLENHSQYERFRALEEHCLFPSGGFWIFQMLSIHYMIVFENFEGVLEALVLLKQRSFLVPYSLLYTVEHSLFLAGKVLIDSVDFQLGAECLTKASQIPKTIFSLKHEIQQSLNKFSF